MKSLYEISAPIAVGGRGSVALQGVVAYLNARLADHDGRQLTVARDEIEIHLRGLPRWQMADGRWQMADGRWQMADDYETSCKG